MRIEEIAALLDAQTHTIGHDPSIDIRRFQRL